jgi:polar amino acid transport system substrate-binding protein
MMTSDNLNAARAELAPSGTLRVGIAVGPTGSPLWATRNPATGAPQGVTVDLGNALAKKLGTAVEFVVHSSSGEITEAADKNAWDVSFMPVDEERKAHVDFGPNYALGESTFLAAPGSPIKTIAEVDRAGVRVAGVEGTTTIRAARRSLKNTSVSGTKGATEILELLKAGDVDAVALGRDSLEDFARIVKGSRVLDGHFWAVGVAVATPKNRPAALAYATQFIEEAKEDGTVARAFAAAKLKDAQVAPAGSRS